MAGNQPNVKVTVTSAFDSRGITQAERAFRGAYQQQARAEAEMTRAMQQQAAARNAAINTTANTLGALGLAMTAAVAIVVKTAADFDQAMSNVAATGVGSLDGLREAAMKAGRDTAYSASEAAFGIEQLAKAGVSASDIIGGGLSASLSLASAAGLDVARASEITAVTLKQFGLQGKDASHVADLLAAGANKAVGGVEELSQALEYVGPVAAQMGVSVEESTGALALFAEQGILGQKAGTGLRGVIMALSAPSAIASKTMQDLGISVFDAQGKFVGLSGVAGQLQSKLGGLTEAERSAALGRIFGNEQITAARILYQAGAKDVQAWTDAVDESGYAAAMASAKLDNLKGDLKILQGSVETLMISMGEGAQGPLRTLTQAVTGVVNELATVSPAGQTALLGLVGGGGLVTLGVAGAMKLTVALGEIKTALRTLNVSAKSAGIAVGSIGAALAVASLAIAAWAQSAAEAQARTQAFKETLDEVGSTTARTVSEINDALSRDRRGWADRLFGEDPKRLVELGRELGLTIDDLRGYILGQADATTKVEAAMQDYVKTGTGSQQQMMEHTGAVNDLRAGLNAEASALSDAQREAALKAEADRQAGIAAQETEEFTRAATDAIEANTNALSDNVDAQSKAAGVALSLWDAQTNLEEAYADATGNLDENTKGLDASTEAGRKNRDTLSDLASKTWDLIDSMTENGATLTDLRGEMTSARDRFVAMAESMGVGADEAQALADQMNLIPAKITPEISIIDKASTVLDSLWTKITRLPSGLVITTGKVTGESTYKRGSNMAASYAGNLFDFYAEGGLRPAQQVAQFAPPNSFRVFGDRADVPEAYIPVNNSVRSHQILAETAQRMGYQLGGGSLVGVEISGTLETPWGPAEVRGVVRDELGDAIASARRGLRARNGVSG